MKTPHTPFLAILICNLLLITSIVKGQSVTIGTISGTQFCAGDPISVTFTATGSWGAGNVFLLQLSDPTGSFSNGFQYIGSVANTQPGTFTIDTTIGGSAGSNYRLRILATNPLITSADNGSDIAIGTWLGEGGEFSNDLTGGSIGTPMPFSVALDASNDNGDLSCTGFWDFGSGATPATATTPGSFDGLDENFSQDVTYSTTGDKTIALTVVVTPGGCSATLTYEIHIYDCSDPVIPHDAIVISSNATAEVGKAYWVNPGFTLNLVDGADDGAEEDTIFAEAGSTIVGYGNNCVIYMKDGSVLNLLYELAYNSVIFGDGASINGASNDFTLNCPALDFDYSNAPPNPAHPSASVKNDLNSVPITLSPNPTGGIISVQGLPLGDITVSVFNVIGETVMVQKNPPSPNFTLDLSTLVSGTYYIRFSSANSVVTKAIIKN